MGTFIFMFLLGVALSNCYCDKVDVVAAPCNIDCIVTYIRLLQAKAKCYVN